MRVLVDAHALIWYVDQDHFLSTAAHVAITSASNDLFLSAATVWEIGIKVGLRKLSLSLPIRKWMNKAIADLRLTVLPITVWNMSTRRRRCRGIMAIRSIGCWWHKHCPRGFLL